jgi:hypothetical protein
MTPWPAGRQGDTQGRVRTVTSFSAQMARVNWIVGFDPANTAYDLEMYIQIRAGRTSAKSRTLDVQRPRMARIAPGNAKFNSGISAIQICITPKMPVFAR